MRKKKKEIGNNYREEFQRHSSLHYSHSFLFPYSIYFKTISVTIYCTLRQVFENLPITVLPDTRLAAVWKRKNRGEVGWNCRWGPSASPHLAPSHTWGWKGHDCPWRACWFWHCHTHVLLQGLSWYVCATSHCSTLLYRCGGTAGPAWWDIFVHPNQKLTKLGH